MKSLIQMMDDGDFVLNGDEDLENFSIKYTDCFVEWFLYTTGNELTEHTLGVWFNQLLRNSLEAYDERQRKDTK